ncbi:uncharacterized protein LOC103312158 isoform X1 [Tribolium castaneum]|uniref:uncharacterized protein LOC103312158 isoform X1 n=1 Tax=Tribolium castaneum TaxID=7070 RepID=UPI0030FDFBAD
MEMCTAQGHVVGMLDRDQRTAKVCRFDRHVVLVKEYEDSRDQTALTRRNKTISHRSVPGRTSPHSSCKTRKNRHFWKSLHRLKHALIVGAYLSLFTFPSIESAPTIRTSKSMSRAASKPKWFNPCGMSAVNGAAPEHRMPDVQLIDQILNQAQIAEVRAKMFKEEYVHKTFNMDAQQLHNYYKDKDYDWLPTKEIPKNLDQAVPQEHLDTLEFKPTLTTVYSNLQKFAVGIEQIVWDEEDRNGPFKSSFVQTEDYLRTLLCEIYTAIIEKELTVEQNVDRDIMGPEFRNMDNTSMNIRNWIIYRDYLNMLEYIIQVFRHFKAKIE